MADRTEYGEGASEKGLTVADAGSSVVSIADRRALTTDHTTGLNVSASTGHRLLITDRRRREMERRM